MQSSEVKPRVYKQLSCYISFLSVAVTDYSEEKQSAEEWVIDLYILTTVHKKGNQGRNSLAEAWSRSKKHILYRLAFHRLFSLLSYATQDRYTHF